MKKLITTSLLATGVMLAGNVQAATFASIVSGNFSETFTITPQTLANDANSSNWFRFAVTADAGDFNPFHYTISEVGNPGVSFSGLINPVGATYKTGFLDKADNVQNFSSGHSYSLTISGDTKTPGNKSFTLTSNSSITPVPEPESYAMLLAGLGLIGTIARRRRSKAV